MASLTTQAGGQDVLDDWSENDKFGRFKLQGEETLPIPSEGGQEVGNPCVMTSDFPSHSGIW